MTIFKMVPFLKWFPTGVSGVDLAGAPVSAMMWFSEPRTRLLERR